MCGDPGLENLNLFESMEFLEPKCPKCGKMPEVRHCSRLWSEHKV